MVVDYREKIEKFDCCIIVPTYNNAATLGNIIKKILEITDKIIIVNDGSDDETEEVLKQFSGFEVIHLKENRGKGYALRAGFKTAVGAGFKYALTIDSDGQHQPEDFSRFIDKIQEHPNSIIVGARNMDQESVPGKSSFGHKFSNFWFRFETGIDLEDTQSGFRLYPVYAMRNMNFFTNRFEFEIEVIVRSVWKGIGITSVPVKVHYEPKESRVSHFRPFQDFGRVSLLNTLLVFISIFYIKPKKILRSMLKL